MRGMEKVKQRRNEGKDEEEVKTKKKRGKE